MFGKQLYVVRSTSKAPYPYPYSRKTRYPSHIEVIPGCRCWLRVVYLGEAEIAVEFALKTLLPTDYRWHAESFCSNSCLPQVASIAYWIYMSLCLSVCLSDSPCVGVG